MCTPKKECSKCGVEKPLFEFHKKSKAPDGRKSWCKSCCRGYMLEYKHTEVGVESLVRSRQKYRATPKGRSLDIQQAKNYKAKYPKRYKAQRAIANGVYRGKILKQPCEVCSNPMAEAHHDDYDKPLDVRWLCKFHHKEWHNRYGEGLNG